MFPDALTPHVLPSTLWAVPVVCSGRKLVANGGNGGWGGDVVLRATSGHNGEKGLGRVEWVEGVRGG